MVFELHIELGNAAMKTYDDLADALHTTAEKLRTYDKPTVGKAGPIRDINGNAVGRWSFENNDPGNGDNVL